MKTKQVTRYSCEFCGKSGYSAPHMTRHEKSCTKNPDRVCRVCQMDHNGMSRGEAKQAPIEALLACLPDPKEFMTYGAFVVGPDGERFSNVVNSHLPELRKASGNCPACIMAALRQKGIPVPLATDFDFKKEMEVIWTEINDANRMENYE